MHYLEAAKQRFPGHCVGGSGRYAVYAPQAGPLSKILLYETHREATNQILDPRYAQVVDLDPVMVDLDRMPDRHWEKRDRRA
ncbi:MAG TPA: hypothetical protein VNO32_43300 [Candidatus Acidoferrum sp.]|nr:hypothetical protein [Candidatus Acidoferrum sp.]